MKPEELCEELVSVLKKVEDSIKTDPSILLDYSEMSDSARTGLRTIHTCLEWYNKHDQFVKQPQTHIQNIDRLDIVFKHMDSIMSRCQKIKDLCQCNAAFNANCLPSTIKWDVFSKSRGYILKQVGYKNALDRYERPGEKEDFLKLATFIKKNFVDFIPHKLLFGLPMDCSDERNSIPFWIDEDIKCYFCIDFQGNSSINDKILPLYSTAEEKLLGNIIFYSTTASYCCTRDCVYGKDLKTCAFKFIKFLDDKENCPCRINLMNISNEEYNKTKDSYMKKVFDEELTPKIFKVWDDVFKEIEQTESVHS